jgi:TonB family protein
LPVPPPDEVAPPPARVIQGLSNDAFLEGAGTNLTVRAGTTTGVRAKEETLSLDEADAFALLPFATASRSPSLRYAPALVVPDSVIETEVEGVVEIELDLDEEGKVKGIRVTRPLAPDADQACVDAMTRSRWKPAGHEGQPVGVSGVPYRCRFEARG